jgi:hypothetical protein
MKRILSISGGGAGGAGSAYALKLLNEKLLTTMTFDAYAGTSVGAIIATALAKGYTTNQVYLILQQNLKRVFTKNSWWDRNIRRKPIYNNKYLRHVLNDLFGDMRMDQLEKPCYLVAYQVTGDTRRRVFGPNCNHKVVDCVMASAAAPWYFDSISIGGVKYGDGGLVENMPSTIGLAKEYERSGGSLYEYSVLSVVTGGTSRNVKKGYKSGSPLSLLKKIPKTMINANVDNSLQTCDTLLQERHCVLRPHLPDFELDDVGCAPKLKKAWCEYIAKNGLIDVKHWLSL